MAKERVNTDSAIKKWLWRSDFIYYYWFRISDYRKFREINKKDLEIIVDKLISGSGGIGNIKEIRKHTNLITIHFSSRYLLRKDDLNSSGGIGLTIYPNYLTILFYRSEVKNIFKSIRSKINEFNSKYVSLDQD